MKIKLLIAAASVCLTCSAQYDNTVEMVEQGDFIAKSYNLEYKPNTETHVYFDLINPIEIYAFQCDIKASPALGITEESVTLATNIRGTGHQFTTSTLADGTIMVSAINFGKDTSLSGNEGKLFDIGFIMPAEGTYRIDFSYIVLATDQGRVQLPNFGITIKSDPTTTGIEDVEADADANARYFDLNGVEVSHPDDGRIYIRLSQGVGSKEVHRSR